MEAVNNVGLTDKDFETLKLALDIYGQIKRDEATKGLGLMLGELFGDAMAGAKQEKRERRYAEISDHLTELQFKLLQMKRAGQLAGN